MVNNICPYPWTSLYLNYDGEISPCCFHYSFANIRDNKSLQEIWNGKEARCLRDRWATGNLKRTPCENCSGLNANKKYKYPIRHIGSMPSGDYTENAMRNFKEFSAKATFLQSMPVEVLYVPSTLCNIDCIHCCQPRYDKTQRTCMSTDLILQFYKTFGFMAVRHLLSGGEPLGLSSVYDLLDQMPQEQKQVSELVVLTNGLLLKRKWDNISGFNRYSFEMSIASLRSEIYERIHRKAKFDVMISALEFINKIKQNNPVKLIRIMALMKSNYPDLAEIVPMAKKYGFDETWIFPVHSSDGKKDLLIKENIFGLPHILSDDHKWRFERALLESEQAGMAVTVNHLKYVDWLLPKSAVKIYTTSAKTLLSWPLRKIILAMFPFPKVRRFIVRMKSKI